MVNFACGSLYPTGLVLAVLSGQGGGMAKVVRIFWRGMKWGGGVVLLAAVCYFGLAGMSVLFPVQGRVQVASPGPPVFVCAGTVHTDFAVPVALAQSEAFGELAALVPEGLPPETYVLMGWGDYRFFTEVPYASDYRPGIALGALAGRHDTALRLIFVRAESLQSFCRELPLDVQGQAAIGGHIRETVGAIEVMPASTFGVIYVKALKRYGVFYTCNDWTSDALRKAGLPTARWIAPFAVSVTWPLRGLDEG